MKITRPEAKLFKEIQKEIWGNNDTPVMETIRKHFIEYNQQERQKVKEKIEALEKKIDDLFDDDGLGRVAICNLMIQYIEEIFRDELK
jgi:hypothetical protein